MFTGTEAGQRLQAKLDSFLQGIDPENPLNEGRIPGFGDKMSNVAKIWDTYRQQNPSQITEAMTSGTRGGLLTHPLRELSRAVNQAWFSVTKPAEDMQIKGWVASGRKPAELPDEENIAYLQQFIPGSSVGQMGRGTVYRPAS